MELTAYIASLYRDWKRGSRQCKAAVGSFLSSRRTRPATLELVVAMRVCPCVCVCVWNKKNNPSPPPSHPCSRVLCVKWILTSDQFFLSLFLDPKSCPIVISKSLGQDPFFRNSRIVIWHFQAAVSLHYIRTFSISVQCRAVLCQL